MKSLLPLARANKADCEKLCESLGTTRLSSRQLGVLYAAWRSADLTQRERIVTAPLLFLKAKEVGSPEAPAGMSRQLVRELDAARVALLRASEERVRVTARKLSALRTATDEDFPPGKIEIEKRLDVLLHRDATDIEKDRAVPELANFSRAE